MKYMGSIDKEYMKCNDVHMTFAKMQRFITFLFEKGEITRKERKLLEKYNDDLCVEITRLGGKRTEELVKAYLRKRSC